MTRHLSDVLRDYEAAWNEPDAAARERRLNDCVTHDVTLAPGYKPDAPALRGRPALSAEIGEMVASRPAERGMRLSIVGPPQEHHGWVRFADRALRGS